MTICADPIPGRAYWLFKSEPSSWSWAQQCELGERGAEWDGVRNALANQNMRAMRLGDRGFFYHSVKEKQIVGIVAVIREHYPDPTDVSGRFGMVDIRALAACPQPVTLAQIKVTPSLAEMVLIRQARLSVQPVTESAWQIILAMSGFDTAMQQHLNASP